MFRTVVVGLGTQVNRREFLTLTRGFMYRGSAITLVGNSQDRPPLRCSERSLPTKKPDAGNLHVRYCEGWRWQHPHLLRQSRTRYPCSE
jgi:hypothetical protein